MPAPFAAHVLREWHSATSWSDDTYANLTRSSRVLLDFLTPRGLAITVSKAPSPTFVNSATLNALAPAIGKLSATHLDGSISYFASSAPGLKLGQSGRIPLRSAVEHFHAGAVPQRPVETEEIWLRGRRHVERDYLLYGRVYIPSTRLDGLYALRLSPSTQALASYVYVPTTSVSPLVSSMSNLSDSTSSVSPPVAIPSSALLTLGLHHDTGRWTSDCSYSFSDGIFGARFLHNFGKLDTVESEVLETELDPTASAGLKGRFSAGAELYLSAKQRSAGLSAGVRFATTPDAALSASGLPSQPPTVMTLTCVSLCCGAHTCSANPMMGHVSATYAARVGPDLALCSRYGFNFHSFDSELTVGGEWFQRRARRKALPQADRQLSDFLHAAGSVDAESDIIGVLKARASTGSDMAFVWESRFKDCLIGFGFTAAFAGRQQPFKTVGLSLSYWA